MGKSKKDFSAATFNFDQLAKNEMAIIVKEGGGGGGGYSTEVDSAVENHGIGWLEPGEPITGKKLTWDGVPQTSDTCKAMNKLFENKYGPFDDYFNVTCAKISDQICELNDMSIIESGFMLTASNYEESELVFKVSGDYKRSSTVTYTSSSGNVEFYADPVSSMILFAVSTAEGQGVEVDGRMIEIETGIYFLKTTIHNPVTGDLSYIIYPSELILEESSKEQEEIAITTTLEELDPISSSDLSIFLSDYYAIGSGLDNIRWGKVADPISEGLDALVNKSEIFTVNSIPETQNVTSSYNPVSIMLPSITDLYLGYVNYASPDEDPTCVIIGTDINISPDPEDPSYIISFPAGVYFPLYDMGHGEVAYASKLILQQEHHVESIVHKIDDKFISGPMFIYAAYDASINQHVMNKTWGEIKEAYNSNIPLFINIVNNVYPSKIGFNFSDNEITCWFPIRQGSGETGLISEVFTVNSDDDYPKAYPPET